MIVRSVNNAAYRLFKLLAHHRCGAYVPRGILVAVLVSAPFSNELQAEVFQYVNEQGRKIFVDHPQKIPMRFREQHTAIAEESDRLSAQQKQALAEERASAQQTLTAQRSLRKLEAERTTMVSSVIIRGNQVIVPVKVVWRGRSVSVNLLLDTGASMTVLHRDAVASLNPTRRSSSYAQVAGGGVIQTDTVIFDRLDVGPYELENKTTAVIENQRSAGFDGLLGMDILGRVRYEIDFSGRRIIWDPEVYRQLGALIEAYKQAPLADAQQPGSDQLPAEVNMPESGVEPTVSASQEPPITPGPLSEPVQ